MKIIERETWVYYINEEKVNELNTRKVGKWMYFFSERNRAEKLCKDAVEDGIVIESKHSNASEGVSCFYLNVDDYESHKRVIEFFIKNDMIQKTKTNKYYNISFKLDLQTSQFEYGNTFAPVLKLEDFVDLNTGKWKEIDANERVHDFDVRDKCIESVTIKGDSSIVVTKSKLNYREFKLLLLDIWKQNSEKCFDEVLFEYYQFCGDDIDDTIFSFFCIAESNESANNIILNMDQFMSRFVTFDNRIEIVTSSKNIAVVDQDRYEIENTDREFTQIINQLTIRIVFTEKERNRVLFNRLFDKKIYTLKDGQFVSMYNDYYKFTRLNTAPSKSEFCLIDIINNSKKEFCQIPAECNNISRYAFRGNSEIRGVELNKITIIEEYAFSDSSLEEIIIPEGVAKIYKYAFYNCKRLKKVVLNGCMKKIYLGVFNGCSALTDVEISSDIKVLGNSCFKSCTALKEIHLEQIQSIERDAVVNGRFCPQSVRRFCPIIAGFNAGTYKVPACVL